MRDSGDSCKAFSGDSGGIQAGPSSVMYNTFFLRVGIVTALLWRHCYCIVMEWVCVIDGVVQFYFVV